MKTVSLFASSAMLFLYLTVNSQGQKPPEAPLQTTLCAVLQNPAAWDRKLMEISVYVTHGFEDSTIFDTECDSAYRVWMEYGGRHATGTMSTVSNLDRSRSKELASSDGSPLPLVEDAAFRKLDDMLHPPPPAQGYLPTMMVHATVVGTFFAGRVTHGPAGDYWSGYGHLGGSSLFIVQQVTSVADRPLRQDEAEKILPPVRPPLPTPKRKH